MNVNFKKIGLLLAITCAALNAGSLAAHPEISKVVTDQAPKAIGPYSQAIAAGPFLFISGQIPLDPVTGKLVGDGIEEQTNRVWNNIEAILASQGLTTENLVQVTVYLTDLQDFASMNSVYAKRFSTEVTPARATVQVSKLPLNARLEISCTALRANS